MKPKNKYIIYARKSTESDERQTQSINDQLTIMKERANFLWLDVVDILTESKSAKAPWRTVFDNMMHRIEKWEADWIISWKLDRLSRNPIDSWKIQYMLQVWKLDKVITNDKEYTLVDAGLLMSVENWMSNQFLLDLSKNVKRWIKSKAEKWWFPWAAPLWYENELKYHTIIEDNIKFELVQRMWHMMITWDHTVKDIKLIATNKWWLRTKKWKPLHISTMYAIFNNVFYTWDFLWKWNIMEWKHKAMITYEEYNRVQDILWKSWKAKLVKHDFSYTWIIKCCECWSMITAWHKHKFIKKTNSIKTYSYYWCTKKVKNIKNKCSQKAIRKEELEKQINEILWSLEIMPEFKEWAVKIIREDYKKDIDDREWNILRLQNEEIKSRNKIDKLTDMLLDWRITDAIFDKKRILIELEIKQLKEGIINIDVKRKNKIEKLEDMFNFIIKARESFTIWDFKTKKSIFKSLGLNFTMNEWKIVIELYPWLEIIKNNQYALNRTKWRFTPIKNSTGTSCTDTISSIIPKWQGP